MKAWFYGLQTRERWIVAVGAVLFVVIIGWGFVLKPLNAEIARLQASVDTKQRLLIDVTTIEGQQPSTPGGGRVGMDETLAVIIDNTARSHGLNPSRTRANGPDGVDVSLQDAPFDALAAWLVALHDTYGVDVETASFTNTRAPGLVNANLLLRRL